MSANGANMLVISVVLTGRLLVKILAGLVAQLRL